MSSNSPLPDFVAPETVRQWIVNRMATLALQGESQIEIRTLFGFQQAGISIQLKRSDLPHVRLADVVENPQHRLRVPAPLGPGVVVRVDHEGVENGVFQVANMLLDKALKQRRAALYHLDQLAAAGMLTQRSTSAIADTRENLLSRSKPCWGTAAATIYDAIEEDWLLNLAGLRQAIAWQLDEGIKDYLPKVLRPSIVGIDSLDIVWWHPRAQQSEIQQFIAQTASTSETLHQAIDHYFETLGHVPLASDLSLGALVTAWCSQHADEPVTWQDLRAWADSKNSPLARYHICQTAATCQALILTGSTNEFWEEVSTLLTVQSGDEDGDMSSWQFRSALARHYCKYFECLVPWNDGERVPALAWWLTERVASLFDGKGTKYEHFDDIFFTPTHLHWHLARPRAGTSSIRRYSLFSPMLWQSSLMSQMLLETKPEASIATAEPDHRRMFEACLLMHSLQDFRHDQLVKDQKNLGYACEFPLGYATEKQAVVSPSLHEEDLVRQLLETFQKVSSKPITELVHQLCEGDTVADCLVVISLRNAVYADAVVPEALDKLMRDDVGAKVVLTGLDETALHLLADVLMETAAAAESDWRVLVPHVLANACLGADDEERRNLLFLLTVHASAATDTVSAIRFLLQRSSPQLREYARNQHDFLSAHLTASPQWVAARLRAIVTALDV